MGVRRLSAWLALASVLGITLSGAAAGPRTYREPGLISAPGYRGAEDLSAISASDRAWLAGGRIPGADSPWRSLATWALLDLHAFMRPDGAVAAGPGGAWTYTWPRDASFVAVALSRAGHGAEAERVLEFLSSLPIGRYGLDARYTLDGGRVTGRAARPAQADGCGWALWAVGTVRAGTPPMGPPLAAAGGVDDLVDRCTGILSTLTDRGRHLPPPTPDYLEQPASGTTLASVAPMVTGLRAASGDYLRRGETQPALAAALVADELRATITARLGPRYERYGAGGGPDAGSAMLMPPFGEGGASATAAWLRYQHQALTPSGGLAPAVDWPPDGNAWTPETALVAYTAAASGHTDIARHWLTWLARHRTAYGSVPEKVTRSGRPAGPAPLLWTSAMILLTLSELDDH